MGRSIASYSGNGVRCRPSRSHTPFTRRKDTIKPGSGLGQLLPEGENVNDVSADSGDHYFITILFRSIPVSTVMPRPDGSMPLRTSSQPSEATMAPLSVQ